MMMFIMSCYGAGSMSKFDNKRLANPEFCDDDAYNVMLQVGSMSKYDNRRPAKPKFCDDDVYNVM